MTMSIMDLLNDSEATAIKSTVSLTSAPALCQFDSLTLSDVLEDMKETPEEKVIRERNEYLDAIRRSGMGPCSTTKFVRRDSVEEDSK